MDSFRQRLLPLLTAWAAYGLLAALAPLVSYVANCQPDGQRGIAAAASPRHCFAGVVDEATVVLVLGHTGEVCKLVAHGSLRTDLHNHEATD